MKTQFALTLSLTGILLGLQSCDLTLHTRGLSDGKKEIAHGPGKLHPDHAFLPLASPKMGSEHPVKGHQAQSTLAGIASQGKLSTEAGIRILKAGGNLIDAAIAVSFANAVERPQSTGLGGGGFLLYREAKTGSVYAYDFRETAPSASTKKMYLDKEGNVVPTKSLVGIFASATPGLVDGLVMIHGVHGKLPLAKVMAPAIAMAKGGIAVNQHLLGAIKKSQQVLSTFRASKEIFLPHQGMPPKLGETFKQIDLATTLELIATQGRSGFYKGSVAKALVGEMKKRGGLVTQKDLDTYKTLKRTPLIGTFQGHKIISMPPPSSGGAHILQMLNILEKLPLAELGPGSPQTVHWVSSAMQMAFADRAKFLGDPDFVDVPLQGLIAKEYAASLRGQMMAQRARSSAEVSAGKPYAFNESNDTTHFSMMDMEGNVVSSTQTINGKFGSGLVVPGTGVLLNSEMDDFVSKPGVPNKFGAVGGEENAIAPFKRPLSSMSPTIIVRDGEPVLSLGSPNGTRIISCVLHTVLNYVVHEFTLYRTVASLRYHHQWSPDEIRVEEPYFDQKTKSALENMGYKIKESSYPCRVQAVAKEGSKIRAVSDPRGEGYALGR